VPIGTDLSTLAPTVTISADATVSPLSGAAGDFTNPVIYTVTAQDSSTQDYTVTVIEVAANTEKEIVFFSVGANAGVIDNGNHTVDLLMPFGTDLSKLTPAVTISASATVSPLSGTTVDFTNPVTYTVTAQDSSTQDYTVTVSTVGASVSLNLVGNVLAPADVAGAAAYARDNWNNTDDGGGVVTGNGSAGSHNGLKDDSGTLVTGMTMTWTGTFVSNAGSSGGTAGDTIMMQYALLAAGQGSSATLDITNIPYAKYEIVVYTHSNYPNRGAEVSVTGSPDTYVHLPSAAGFSGTYTQVTSTDAFNPGVGNYSVHKGLTASSATITWTPLSELGLKNEGRVTGIQVVEVASLSAYADWAAGFPGFTSTAPELDFDDDGLANLLEFVLVGNPTVHDIPSISPSFNASGTSFELTFSRSDESEDRVSGSSTLLQTRIRRER
jgi:hypothetical protein